MCGLGILTEGYKASAFCLLYNTTILHPDTTTIGLRSSEVINKKSFSVVIQWSFDLFIINIIVVDVTSFLFLYVAKLGFQILQNCCSIKLNNDIFKTNCVSGSAAFVRSKNAA